ncbi:hypothetical protein QN400_21375 [Pseudomonas sp. RTC3]|uniref:hypothetical protein n=1 Tax=Pseudomonas sp. 5C2 TaxID=3048588 RepID=UPI002AB35DD4|nr:hypothetical protein [Pseudomonas sp. 5C2]MDY7567505.1 hypothetical protein [Pseudomonas sp. 5C2]MEB0064568.1 hypothetical protein [Pseudomonas sp. RTC3]MEB0243024.1 hypothetical protein [Pseudomonas sp. 5C2]
MSIEAYSVAVKLSLINHVSSGLLMISKNLHTTGMDADLLNSKLMSIGKQAAIGGAMFGGGLGIAAMFKGPLDSAITYQKEMSKLRQQGLGQLQISEAMKFSEANKIIGTSLIDRTKMFTDAQGAFRESGKSGFEALAAAKVISPVLAQYQVATGMLADGKQGMAHEQFMQMSKTMELMGGLNDANKAAQIADGIFKTVQSSGKMVSERDLRLFMSHGGVAVAGLTQKTIFAGLEPIIGELHGSMVATGLQTAFSRTHGMMALTPSITTNEMLRLGVWDANKVARTKGGGARFLHGSPMNAGLAHLQDTNTVEFAQAMMGIYAKKHITSLTDMGRENNILFGRTGGAIYTRIMQQMPVLLHSLDAYDKAQGISQTIEANKGSPMMKTLELSKAMDDLSLSIGQNVMPVFLPMLTKLTELSQELGRHPALIKGFTYSLIGLSTVLVTGGLVNMIAASSKGFGLLFTVLSGGGGITGAVLTGVSIIGKVLMIGLRAIPVIGWVMLAVAAGIYLYRNWDMIWTKTKAIWGKVSPYIIGAFQWIGDAATSIWTGIKSGMKSFVGFFLDQWQWLFNTVVTGINSMLPAGMAFKKATFADSWSKSDKQWLAGSPLVTPYPAHIPITPLLMVPPSTSNGQPLPGAMVAPVPPRQAQTIQVSTRIDLSGKKIAEAVTEHQAKELSRPNTGTNGFDPSRSMLMPGTPSAVYPRG